jgi:hypothetical protein
MENAIIEKTIWSLTTEELKAIFCGAFSRNGFDGDRLRISREECGEYGYIAIYCEDTGYSLTILSNYSMIFDSDCHPVRSINMMGIYSAMLSIGAVKSIKMSALDL